SGEQQSVADVLWQQLKNMIPTNPLEASAEGDMLPIIFFSILLGIFISATGGHAGTTLRRFFEALFEVMRKMTLFIILLAPVGVLGFMLYAAAGKGLSAFEALGKYALTVFLALVVHAFLVLPALLALLGRRNPWPFLKDMTPALLTAFSTASSN